MNNQNQQPRGLQGTPGGNRFNNGYNQNQNQNRNNNYNQQNQGYNNQNRNNQPQRNNQNENIPSSVFANNYQPQEMQEVEEGEYRFKIVSITTSYTQTNHEPMIKIILNSDFIPFEMKINIVKNQWFDINITKFFDCFEIERGNFNFNSWIGQSGICEIEKKKNKETGKKYFDISKYIVQTNNDVNDDQPDLNSYDNYVPDNQDNAVW